ncbi:MAG: UDP-N-acetylmuramoyl-L-alanyl-D-glutamate--2,6-diaminopimelate ligase, partial [Desulfobulbus sp.]|nr:UDP-N-acetylmuramoyl-L-alanyl-D-glutamate--2,6-diaminopimelate ligase [Desulfobulbus sp.]
MITLARIFDALGARERTRIPAATLDREVTAVTADSRRVIPGSLFVAVRGEKADGRAFLPEAIRRGCLAVVVEEGVDIDALSVPVLVVPDTHAALAAAAAAWHGYPARHLRLIGITGTNGKTTTSWLIEALLLHAGYRPGVIGTVDYRYHGPDGLHVLCQAPLTTPDPVTLQGLLRTMVDGGATHVVMEVSSHALEQNRLGRLRFDVALFTNLSRDHLDYHQTMERYFAAKELLFQRHLATEATAVIVSETAEGASTWGERLAATLADRRVIRCGFSAPTEVRVSDLVQTMAGFSCVLHLGDERCSFSSPLTGGYNVLNILAAAATGLGLGLPVEQIRTGLAGVGRVPGRLERVTLADGAGAAGPAVFVDYAHTPDALENVLLSLRPLATGRLVCVFGCGGDRDRGKRPLMGAIAARWADVAIVTSDNSRTEDPETIVAAVAAGAASTGRQLFGVAELLTAEPPLDGYAVLSDRRQAIVAACSLPRPEDTVLIAGKGHEDYQILGTEKHFFDDRLEAANALACWNARHLLAATGGRVVSGRQSQVFRRISTDTRTIEPGDVFVALRGEQFDGHNYIDRAVRAGAAAVLVDRLPEGLPPEVLAIEVDDTLQALGALAGYRRRLFAPRLQVAAITGSSGKTTVKELVAAIFAEAMAGVRTGIDPLLKTRGNFNNLVGLPLSLLPVEAGHRLAILEMGMNAPGEIARLVAIADPDIGCINNVQPAHLQGLGCIEGVAAAKGELFAGMRPEAVRVVNCDDPLVVALARADRGRQIGFAVTPWGRRHNPVVRVTRQRNLGEAGMRFTLHLGDWAGRFSVPMPGSHNVSNCAAAAAIAHAAGIGPAVIVRGLQRYTPVDKRLVVSEMAGGLRVVNDAYNANPASMAAGLRTVAAFGERCRHLAALGDMLELGPDSEELHREIGALVANLGYDFLAVNGARAEAVAAAARTAGKPAERVRTFAEPRSMADWLSDLLAG